MTTKPETKAPEPKMDLANLYREEIYTDRKMGTIRVMIPVTSAGTTDAARKTVYIGEAQLMTQMGALPLNFEIEAQSLGDAVAKYGPAVKQAFERAMQEIQEMRRQQSSSIVIPERGAGGFGPGGLPGGGLPGGGKIKLP
jgi:hypothetical protein